MRLHVNFDLATEINHVGKLALVGSAEKYRSDVDVTVTTITFLLDFSGDNPLAHFYPQGGIGPNTELLYSIFVVNGIQPVESPDRKQSFLIFNVEVPDTLRDPRKFLRATAKKLYKELQMIEDDDLWLCEQDKGYSWAQDHACTPATMPDFTQPRHDDARWCKSEFTDVAQEVFSRIEQERPRVIVPVYTERKGLVEQFIRDGKQDDSLSDIVAYVSDTSHSEEHREEVLFTWLTGYGQVPKAN
ncbi:MAG: hypothetical protein EXS59_01775 [Candidatus Taylorbacteria bacterium]|nr:hypothetical protein [Candidatus Taylorbacteria bacterium]